MNKLLIIFLILSRVLQSGHLIHHGLSFNFNSILTSYSFLIITWKHYFRPHTEIPYFLCTDQGQEHYSLNTPLHISTVITFCISRYRFIYVDFKTGDS